MYAIRSYYAISFLPVFTLGEQSGRLFKPLAFTKTFAMAASSVLAITIIPVLMTFFVREQTVDPNLPRKKKLRIRLVSILTPPVLVILAGIRGADLPDWSLGAALV